MGEPNSVDFQDGVLAVAISNTNPQANGFVAFYDADGNL